MPDEVNSRPRRRKKRSALFAPLSFLLICAALAFALSVFFRVSVIQVEGAVSYTDEEIIEASGIEKGDNLFLVNRSAAISRLFSKLPYVEQASIDRKMPNQIVIHVSESSALAYVSNEDGRWVISRSGKVLFKATDGTDLYNLIQIQGLEPLMPSEGETISAGSGESLKVQYLTDLLTLLEEKGMADDVTRLDLSNAASPSFRYQGRFTVKLGRNENLDYKLELLLSAVSQLTSSDSGTIDLSVDRKAHFSPD